MNFSKKVKIDKFSIDEKSPVFIIAEIGVNHNGDLQLAKKMIDQAAEVGVDAVKFQSFYPEELVALDAPKAPYQLETTNKEESQFSMLEKLRLPIAEIRELKKHTENKNLVFLSTPFEEKSLNELRDLNLAAYKISSTDTTNLLFLKKVAATKKPILLSTGMTTMEELEQAVRMIYEQGNRQLILLHCTANYPTSVEEVNMKAIQTLAETFNVLVGYSDHTEGVGVAPYTIPLGVKVVEKHFTLDKNMSGPDHLASLNVQEFRQLVKKIRYVEQAIGSGIKEPSMSELETKPRMQKKLTFTENIEKDSVIEEHILTAKRSAIGISAIRAFEVIGKKVHRDVKKNEFIVMEDIYE
ncbi:N-acetylneuraminic acid synthetase [Sporosarcina newyorkensis 2681]|uniref:N-acetylneuraminic acid synthetase n=1 Tax=Sporosarcina newyorkensis 2681 TaxID=1027292 RepID=F9DQ87_9BACL|nr:N-acetylneuraminate synthase [Sporosarcina newyorkensis]EGQ27045.1 N-acetylneuraminic acid synthetase [Sporosarcina newyorkensis 2681]